MTQVQIFIPNPSIYSLVVHYTLYGYKVYIEQEAQTEVGSLEICGHFSFNLLKSSESAQSQS